MGKFLDEVQARQKVQISFYIFLGLTVLCQALVFYLNQSIIPVGPRFLFFSLISDIGVIVGLSVILLWRWRWGGLMLLFFYLVLLIVNGVYTVNFNDFFPLSLLAAYKNVDSTLGDFIIYSLRWWMLIMALPFLFIMLFYLKNRKRIEKDCLSLRTRINIMAISLMLFLIGQGYVVSYHIQEEGISGMVSAEVWKEYTSAEHSFHNEVTKWGLMSAYISSMMPWYNHMEFSETDWLTVDCFVNEQRGNLPEKFSAIFEKNRNKRLILIIVESFGSMTFGKEIGGVKIMPYLDSISAANGIIFFPNIITQVKGGMSSDAQLMYNTGIYPLSKGASVVNSKLPGMPSLASSLKKNGIAVELIGESGKQWNHDKTSSVWGYDTLYHSLALGKPGGYFPMADHYIFQKAKDVVECEKDLRMLTICTLSMHGVFSESDLGRFLPQETGETIDMCAYWEMTRKFDDELRGFIDFLKIKGMYDSSVIVIVGDHNPHVVANSDYMPIPFLILNSGVTYISPTIAGQIDVYPTILDVMGLIESKSVWPGVGHSLLRERKGVVGYTRGGKWCYKDNKKDSLEIKRIKEGHMLSEKILSGVSGDFNSEFIKHSHMRYE